MQVQKAKQGYKLVKSLFDKFEEIPEDWDYLALKNLCNFVKGKVPNSLSDITKEGWLPYLSTDYLDRGMAQFTNDKNSVEVKKSDVIMIGDGSGSGRVYAGISGALSSTFILFRTKKSEIHEKFLYYFLKSKNLVLENTKFGTSIPHVDKNILNRLQIPFPPIVEQQKIASILSNVDSLINQTQKEIEQTQRLKKGLMQRLLTKGIGHTKFKKVKWLFDEVEIPSTWELSKLKEQTKLITKGSSPNWQGISYVNEGTLFVTSENIGIGKLILQNKKFVEDKFNESNKRSLLKKGDILTNIVGASIGRTAMFDLDIKTNINQAVALVRLNESLLPEFLVNFLNIPKFVKFMIQGTGETARPNLSLTDVGNFPILIPPLEEQYKISTIFLNLNSKTNAQQSYKSNLETLKKGLMQKLLTGQIRVKT